MLPDAAEELAIEDLGAMLNPGFRGQLGAWTLKALEKFMATKLPVRMDQSRIEAHLETRWGLPDNRRKTILVEALMRPPALRFSSEEHCLAFYDGLAQSYFAEKGLEVPLLSQGQTPESGLEGHMIDPQVIKELRASIEKYHEDILLVHQKHHREMILEKSTILVDTQDTEQGLTQQLALWEAEHGEAYFSGLQPHFTTKKVRTYDSWWNWGMQDLLATTFKILNGEADASSEQMRTNILNRADPRMIRTLEFFSSDCSFSSTGNAGEAREYANELLSALRDLPRSLPVARLALTRTYPRTTISADGALIYTEAEIEDKVTSPSINPAVPGETMTSDSWSSIRSQLAGWEFSLKVKNIRKAAWEVDELLSDTFRRAESSAANTGMSTAGLKILITGAGKHSIGASIVEYLLMGGAQVIVTTSSFDRTTGPTYQEIYNKLGAKGSKLVVLPFNQGSKQDVESLIDYVYSKEDGLGWDLDFVLPFAAISENGNEIDNIDARSELAHRIMLTNTLRLLGAIIRQKRARQVLNNPTKVLLPLSPNHGVFGGDGLYGESKRSLEVLLNKWHSESWKDDLSLCGVLIGWTRGTGLMSSNDLVAETVESLGIRTFAVGEMAAKIVLLMSADVYERCEMEPVLADFSGGMGAVRNLKEAIAEARNELSLACSVTRAIALERLEESKEVELSSKSAQENPKSYPRANLKLDFPTIPSPADEPSASFAIPQLCGVLDLESVVVVVGLAELGPLGNVRTR